MPTPAALPNYRPHAKYVLMLGAIAAVPAISTDIYLPSLPTVAAELGASDSAVQLTMSGMLIGGAVGQLVYGPLTDRFGRKAPLLVGLALHVIISILCAFAPNVSVLIGLRVLQGFCNAAASIVAISVIRDRFTGAPAARLLSQLMLVIGVAPLFAPTIGGFIASIWD
ncbi:MFS transporter, partial [Timonella senegalensis]